MKWLSSIPIVFSVTYQTPIQGISLNRGGYSDCFVPSSDPLVLFLLLFDCLFDGVPAHLYHKKKKKKPSRVPPWHHSLFSQISTHHICSNTHSVVIKAPFFLRWSEASCPVAVWATTLSNPSMKSLVVHLSSTTQWIPSAPSLTSLLPYLLLHTCISVFPSPRHKS